MVVTAGTVATREPRDPVVLRVTADSAGSQDHLVLQQPPAVTVVMVVPASTGSIPISPEVTAAMVGTEAPAVMAVPAVQEARVLRRQSHRRPVAMAVLVAMAARLETAVPAEPVDRRLESLVRALAVLGVRAARVEAAVPMEPVALAAPPRRKPVQVLAVMAESVAALPMVTVVTAVVVARVLLRLANRPRVVMAVLVVRAVLSATVGKVVLVVLRVHKPAQVWAVTAATAATAELQERADLAAMVVRRRR